jgi:WD40 repeat protein
LDPQLQGIEIDWQNERHVAITGKSKNIYLWDIERPQNPVQIWKGGHSFEIEQIKWDPNGKFLASCSTDNKVCLWRTDSQSPHHIFDDLANGISIIQWSNASAEELLLAAGGQDGSLVIWDVGEKRAFCKLPAIEQEGGVKCVAFSPNNKYLATGGQDSLCIWRVRGGVDGSGLLLRHFHKPALFFQSKISGGVGTTMNNMSRDSFQSEFSQVSWSHDGQLLAAAIHNKILVFDVRKLIE